MMARIVKAQRTETPFRKRPVKDAELFVSERSLNEIIEHADSDISNEIMGLLIGNVFADENGQYATVHRTITAPLISSNVSVRFASFDELFDSIDGLRGNETITGWYHSHIGIGCFMSDVDIRTHNGIFGADCGFALVIDPLRKEIRAFGRECKETIFIVSED